MDKKLEKIDEKEQRDDNFLKSWRKNRLGVSDRKNKPCSAVKNHLTNREKSISELGGWMIRKIGSI